MAFFLEEQIVFLGQRKKRRQLSYVIPVSPCEERETKAANALEKT